MMKRAIAKFAVAGVLVGGVAAQAGVYVVDCNHPAASDENPGTADAPWKTIKHAAQVAQSGDTVKIRPGRYREGHIVVSHSGQRVRREPVPAYSQQQRYASATPVAEYITFEADGDEPVVLDGSVEIPPEAWKPLDGVSNVYVAPVPAPSGQPGYPMRWVLLNGRYLQPKVAQAGLSSGDGAKRYKPILAIPGSGDTNQWHHDAEKGLLYLNFGEQTPAAAGQVEAAVHGSAIQGGHNDFLALKGLTIQRFNGRTVDFTRVGSAVVQDCLLRHCGSEAIATGPHAVIRRNTIIECEGIGIAPGSYSKVDENLVLRSFRDPLQTRNGYMGTAITYFGKDFIRLKNNVVLESAGGGFWPDCRGNAHIHFGNTVGYTQGYGFYIESIAFRNTVMNNVVFNTGGAGICLRGNLQNAVVENYLFGCRQPAIVLMHTENYSFMRNNQVVGNYIRDTGVGLAVGGGFRGAPAIQQFSDRNVFDPSVKAVAHWGGTLYKTLEEFRAATGNEPHGRVEAIDEAKLGLVSFRVHEAERSWEPALMFGNPWCTMQLFDWGDDIHAAQYFWLNGVATGAEDLQWNVLGGDTSIPAGEGGALKYSAREADWGGYLVAASPEETQAIAQRQAGQPDAGALEVASAAFLPDWVRTWLRNHRNPETISARGLGYWSVSLPAAGGTIVDIRLHAQGRGIEPTAPDGGLLIFVEWSDYTRRQVRRDYIVGKDEQGQPHLPEKMTGTFAYGPITAALQTPDWARRLRLFLGLKSCSGVVLFDELDTLRVRAGEARPLPQPGLQEARPKPLLDPATLEFNVVDLAAVANRALGDDKADDGIGGWTDQGSGADMSGLPPGRKEYQGVPFEILPGPRSVVVLASPQRPQSKLPESVRIPVGRRADALYFLHDCAWTTENVEHFRYVIRYADGATRDIPIVGGQHIWDWTAGYQARFTRAFEDLRPSVAAVLGGGLVFPEVNLYMLEWLNPRPEQPIEAIDFVSSRAGVPILLGITVGTKK